MILVTIRFQSNFPNTNRLPSRVHNVTSYMLRDIGSEAPILWETHHMQISCYVVPQDQRIWPRNVFIVVVIK